MLKNRAVVGALVAAVFLAGCAGTGNDRRAAAPVPAGERPRATGMIVLPEGSMQALPQAPGAGTRSGAVNAAAVVSRFGGTIVSGTVLSVRTEKGEFDLEYPVTTLQVERTFVGEPGKTVTIRTADPLLEMDEGARYLVFLAKDTPNADEYTPVDTYLFDRTSKGWTARLPSGNEAPEQHEALEITEAQVAEIVSEGQAYLDSRLAAGRAKMTIDPGKTQGEVVVSGYAQGETIELRICAIGDGFNPKVDASLRCGIGLDQVITPDEASFTISYLTPEEMGLGDGTIARCSEIRCGLVAYDAGWPDRVFAVHSPS